MTKLNVVFSANAWNEYLARQSEDKRTLKRIKKLINDIRQHQFEGLKKSEPLKYDLAGTWSRRIDETNRIVYMITSSAVNIIQLGYY